MKLTTRFFILYIAGVGASIIGGATLIGLDVLQFAQTIERRALTMGVMIGVGLIIATPLILMTVYRPSIAGIGQILRAVQDLAKGNFSPKLPKKPPVELSGAIDALLEVSQQLRTVRLQLDGLSQRVVDATGGAGHSFVEVKDGIQAQSGVAARTFDAVGQMSEGLLTASREIETMTGRIQSSATQVAEMDRAIGQVAESISGLKAVIEEASDSTRQGDENVRILARDVGELSAQLNTANIALSDMVAGSERAQTDGSEAARIMDNLNQETERIGAAIEATIEGSDAIHLSNERILEVTASLQSRVDRVDDVLEAVHSLAERTKLLSINASIIASEAGEHGRAFAVVAREVKELAQSTATAISEISVVLVGLKDGFAQTVRTIQRGQGDVDKGIRMARNAVVLLRSIPVSVRQAAELTGAIASRNAGQKAEGYEIKQIVERVGTTMTKVSELLSEQVARNNHTLQLFGTISLTAEQVLGSASDHAAASGAVNSAVEVISGDFRSLAEQVRSNVSGLNTIVHLAEEVLTITDSNRRRAEEVTAIINELNRYALDMGNPRSALPGHFDN